MQAVVKGQPWLLLLRRCPPLVLVCLVRFGLSMRQGLSLAQSSTMTGCLASEPWDLLNSAFPELGLQTCVPGLAFPFNVSSRDRTQALMITR